MNPPSSRVRALCVAGVFAMAAFATLSGQAERAAADDMRALVAEIRSLRFAVERTSSHASQAQVLLGRVQLQENRLATLGRQYLEVRARVIDAQTGQADAEQRLQQVASHARTASDAAERQAIEERIPDLKNELARLHARTAQLQSDEAAALQALTSEQQRWSDVNDRLEALERSLAASAAPSR